MKNIYTGVATLVATSIKDSSIIKTFASEKATTQLHLTGSLLIPHQKLHIDRFLGGFTNTFKEMINTNSKHNTSCATQSAINSKIVEIANSIELTMNIMFMDMNTETYNTPILRNLKPLVLPTKNSATWWECTTHYSQSSTSSTQSRSTTIFERKWFKVLEQPKRSTYTKMMSKREKKPTKYVFVDRDNVPNILHSLHCKLLY